MQIVLENLKCLDYINLDFLDYTTLHNPVIDMWT
jgi:hypothetical protein